MGKNEELLMGLLKAVSSRLIAAEKELTELDSAIGDGDCGQSIKKGFESVIEKLPSLKEQQMGNILKQVGMTISSNIGGVSGAIYATGFLRAGKAIGDKTQLNLQEVHEVLNAVLAGIKERGEGTKVGDKTMVDALEPAINEFGNALAENKTIVAVLERALDAAHKGSESTINMQAKKGRASYLGERSIGHKDAGSVVICLMFESALDYFKNM